MQRPGFPPSHSRLLDDYNWRQRRHRLDPIQKSLHQQTAVVAATTKQGRQSHTVVDHVATKLPHSPIPMRLGFPPSHSRPRNHYRHRQHRHRLAPIQKSLHQQTAVVAATTEQGRQSHTVVDHVVHLGFPPSHSRLLDDYTLTCRLNQKSIY